MAAPRVALLLCLVAFALPAFAAPPPSGVKPPEVTTVGTTPVALSDADRAKLVEVTQRLAARRVGGARAVRPVFRAPVIATAKPADVVTRMPARGTRVRTKPAEASVKP